MADLHVSEELIAQAATHDRLVRHLSRKWGSARAEDLASEAIARAVAAWRRGSLRTPIVPWLHAVVGNIGMDVVRRERAAFRAHSALTPPHADRDDTDALLDVLAVREAITTLAPPARRLVVLRYWGELTLDEIAEATGLSKRHVRDGLYRSRQLLARRLRGVGHVAGDSTTGEFVSPRHRHL